MKVLQINFRDSGGGSTNAAVYLTNELNKLGISASLGVYEKKTQNEFVIKIPEKKHFKTPFLIWLSKKIFMKVTKPIRKRLEFRTTNLNAHETNFKSKIDVNWINKSDFDIVHIHSINGDLISIKDISRINKPIVWTLHDSWPCCGAEHHPNLLENDTRWQEGYKKDNKPETTRGTDLCRKVYIQKKKYLSDKNIVFTAPSLWQKWVCETSDLFSKKRCQMIPNFIYTENFFPKNKSELRKAFRIPEDKKILGFGANYGVDNPNSSKGSFYLIEALRKISDKNNYFLVIFGPSCPEFTAKIDIPYFESGAIYNNSILSCIYNLCDCFINPSLVESFGLTSLESISCGIPVAAFNTSGTKDIIEHKVNGYLAKPYDTDDLIKGIEYCVTNSASMKQDCLNIAGKKFCKDDIMKQFVELYKDILKNTATGK